MNVRRLELSEAELFNAFRLRGLSESPEAFGSTYEEEAARTPEEVRAHFPHEDENFVLGAFDAGGRLVGVAGLYRGRHTKIRHKGFVWGMYVTPEARGRGVGRALLAALFEHAAALDGLEQLVLDVVTVNAAARALYLSHGFRSYGLEPRAMKHRGRYYDLEHMTLPLAEAGPPPFAGGGET